MENYIGISENKVKHNLGVAKKCYEIAKSKGYDEDYCRKMFFVGYIHDIGYEFSENPEEHGYVAAKILESAGITDYNLTSAIKFHGCKLDELPVARTNEIDILTIADLSVDYKGDFVDVSNRLLSIGFRYGAKSRQYINAKHNAVLLGLIDDTENTKNVIYDEKGANI